MVGRNKLFSRKSYSRTRVSKSPAIRPAVRLYQPARPRLKLGPPRLIPTERAGFQTAPRAPWTPAVQPDADRCRWSAIMAAAAWAAAGSDPSGARGPARRS